MDMRDLPSLLPISYEQPRGKLRGGKDRSPQELRGELRGNHHPAKAGYGKPTTAEGGFTSSAAK
jgi:hypothetical protein